MLLLPLIAALQATSVAPAVLATSIEGIFTNEEQVYFERDAGRPPPPWMGVRIMQQNGALVWLPVDAIGAATGGPRIITVSGDRLQIGDCAINYVRTGDAWWAADQQGLCVDHPLPDRIRPQGIEIEGPVGAIRLNRARSFTCWVSVRRHADRANGEADWTFDRALPIHDQGGRVLVSPEGAPPVVIRMRNVVWPAPSTNRPSLVLYVHRPETSDRAESYAWADPDARTVGINLRWMQASCTRT